MLSQSIASSLAVLCAAGLAQADTLSLADIKARNGTQLSEEQLQKLIPGANVVNHAPNGSTRTWTNKPDGSLVASTDSRGRSSTGGTRPHSAEGSWRIENGAYCVKMQWPLAEEKWCRHLYQVGGKYYGVGARADDTAPAMELEFGK
ncbi:MAG TPA: hypothetical protein VMU79_10915 [Casimicrobiaceae bacterium]|jgi:hypothetical protein|nr:hypothetical protein [Casimicrobiaceae bacterium]